MQDMTPEICKNTKAKNGASTVTPGNEVTKQLIDIRDGKKYWVAKLADNNCWMTQNLALDLKEGMTLTSGDTNLMTKTEWKVPTTTETDVPALVDVQDDNRAAYYTYRSWNLGNYVLATPTRGVVCSSKTPAFNESTNVGIINSLRPGDTFATQCSDFVNIDGDWSPIFQAQVGTWRPTVSSEIAWENGDLAGNNGDTSQQGLAAVNLIDRTYDAHYLIGNYYQYNTAVTGDAGSNLGTQQDLANSICPRGWRLPTSGNIAQHNGVPGETVFNDAFTNKKASFYNLLAEYGYSNTKGYIWSGSDNLYTSIIDGSNNDNYMKNVAASPLYFVRSGRQMLLVGALQYAGSDGYFWSSTSTNSSIDAFNLHVSASDLYPSNYYARYNGLSVRCVAE